MDLFTSGHGIYFTLLLMCDVAWCSWPGYCAARVSCVALLDMSRWLDIFSSMPLWKEVSFDQKAFHFETFLA